MVSSDKAVTVNAYYEMIETAECHRDRNLLNLVIIIFRFHYYLFVSFACEIEGCTLI